MRLIPIKQVGQSILLTLKNDSLWKSNLAGNFGFQRKWSKRTKMFN